MGGKCGVTCLVRITGSINGAVILITRDRELFVLQIS